MTETPEQFPPKADDGQPDEKKVARIISDRPRSMQVKLDWPVEFDGKVYEAVEVRRCSGEEVDNYLETIRNGGKVSIPPMIDVPIEVWDAMDDDDRFRVDKEGWVFFPQRLKEFMPSSPGPSEDTSDS